MKSRKGFVSNSSSSSFVVAFLRDPKNVEDVRAMLFNKGQKIFYGQYNNDSYPCSQVAETIWDVISRQKANVKTAIFESIKNGWFDGRADFKEFEKRVEVSAAKRRIKKVEGEDALKYEDVIDWDAYEKENARRANKIAKRFMDKHQGEFIYTFSFADEDGHYYCALEHGDVFSKLDHIRTSYH